MASEGLKRVYRYLHHDNLDHRYWAAVGLGYTRDAASRGELEARRKIETEQKVIGAIDESLAKMADNELEKGVRQ